MFLQAEKKNEKHKADRKKGRIEEKKKDTSHASNEKHACSNTYNRKNSVFNNITKRQESHAVLIQKWAYLFYTLCAFVI